MLIGSLPEEAEAVIAEVCRKRSAPLVKVKRSKLKNRQPTPAAELCHGAIQNRKPRPGFDRHAPAQKCKRRAGGHKPAEFTAYRLNLKVGDANRYQDNLLAGAISDDSAT